MAHCDIMNERFQPQSGRQHVARGEVQRNLWSNPATTAKPQRGDRISSPSLEFLPNDPPLLSPRWGSASFWISVQGFRSATPLATCCRPDWGLKTIQAKSQKCHQARVIFVDGVAWHTASTDSTRALVCHVHTGHGVDMQTVPRV